MRPSGKRNFVTPTLTMLDTPFEIMSGKASIASLAPAQPAPKAIASPTETDIVDAEVIEDHPQQSAARNAVHDCAEGLNIDGDQLWNGIIKQIGATNSITDEHISRIYTAVHKMRDGSLFPEGFNNDGTPIWSKS